MIKKLKRKFIGVAILAIVILLVALLIPMNVVNYERIISRLEIITDYIAENDGDLPLIQSRDDDEEEEENSLTGKLKDILSDLGLQVSTTKIEDLLSPESSYQLRYFTATFDSSGNIDEINTAHTSSLTEEELGEFAEQLYNKRLSLPIASYRSMEYMCQSYEQEDGSVMLVVLECSSTMSSFRMFMYNSIIFALTIVVAFAIIIVLLSKRAMEPFIRNLEIQKQFITNASHELKTPLAIISANNEVIEMMDGESEWTKSISNQVTRMNALVSNLVSLAKMQEKDTLELTDVDMSAIAKDSADSYRTVIENNQLTFTTDIAPDIHVKADAKALQELINILLDNANKYCDEGGSIHISLSKKSTSRSAHLVVMNTYKEGEHTDYSRFFDRFYRNDDSHNSSVSGFGIGLSMAQQIAENMHGKITAEYSKPDIRFVVTI